MVEKIEMQKGYIPVFSARKIKQTKRQNGNMQERRFERDLDKEKDKKKYQTENTSSGSEPDDATGETNKIPEEDYTVDQKHELKSKQANRFQGKLIDIVA